MKLVTYQSGRRGARAGVLIEGGRRVLDLQEAHRLRYGKKSSHLASVLAMAGAGIEALAIAASLVKGAARTRSVTLPLPEVRLLAPIPAAATNARLPVFREASGASLPGRTQGACGCRTRPGCRDGRHGSQGHSLSASCLVRTTDLLPPRTGST